MTSDNEEELTALVGAMVMIRGTAGLPVGKFTSNSAATLAAFQEQSLQSDRAKILAATEFWLRKGIQTRTRTRGLRKRWNKN